MRKITISAAIALVAAAMTASPAAAQYGMDKKGPKNAATPELPHCAQPLGRAAIQEPQNQWWTPLGLSTLLRTMWEDPSLRPYVLAALPIAGETGTLEHRMRSGPAHGLVRAKTGTTDNSSALSGFVGDRYAFSIVENGFPVRALSAEQSQNRFAQVLAHDAAG